MLVLNLGPVEMELVEAELEGCRDMAQENLDDSLEPEDREMYEYEVGTLNSILSEGFDKDRIRRGEFVERCLSFFFDRFKEEQFDNPDVEYLADEMGMEDPEEMRELFKSMGYVE